MSDYVVKRVLEVKADLGESPVWSVDEQVLYWEDIHKKTVNRFDPATGTNKVWEMPAMPGCIALREGRGAVVAARDGIYDLDFTTGALRKLAEAPYDASVYRFNDGKPDRQGRLMVGSFPADYMNTPLENNGVLHQFDGKSIVTRNPVITTPNGICFSPDGRLMYRAVTIHRKVYVCDYDPATGVPTNERLFTVIPDELGMPDGATVDDQGGYWPALPAGPNGGGVARIRPDGTLDFHIKTPTWAPTMPSFGGPDMSTLYVTSACHAPEGAEVDAWAGDLLAIETNFRGLPETKMRLG